MRRPCWRKVVCIGDAEGLRGGALWLLLLDCGHQETRYRPWNLRAFAPKRVKCTFCRVGCEPHPETIDADARRMGLTG